MAIQDVIKEQVTQNKVVLYMKGSPDFPQCGFSARVVEILKSLMEGHEMSASDLAASWAAAN